VREEEEGGRGKGEGRREAVRKRRREACRVSQCSHARLHSAVCDNMGKAKMKGRERLGKTGRKACSDVRVARTSGSCRRGRKTRNESAMTHKGRFSTLAIAVRWMSSRNLKQKQGMGT
jgi:hypothetical protein